nr:RDD family protein [Marinicella sp. W31]MDC2877151.1 RDD family protein [Marinicella sp. W31]
MTEQTATSQRPPRLFLRRLAALIVDFLVYGILATFIVGAVVMAVPQLKDGVASSFFYTRTCEAADSSIPVFAAIQQDWPKSDAGNTTMNARFCTIESFFMPQKRLAVVTESREGENGGTFTRSVSIQLDETGAPVFPSPLIERSVSALQLIAFPLALALSTIFLGWTPGKRIFSLRATTDALAKTPPPLSPARTISREYLKFWPVIANNLIQFAIAAQAPRSSSVAETVAWLEAAGTDQRAIADILVLNAATLLVLFVWWVWPFALWRGRTLYDGFVRAYVVLRN